jgi:hypothetical protein
MRSYVVVAALLVNGIAGAQGVTVSGTVRDSVAGAPLSGAIVQIVADSVNAMPRMATTDSAGRYRIDAVPDGRYIISFLHPLLDSLTLEPVLQSVQVGGQPITFNLATPSGPRLRAVFCGPAGGGNSGAALVGVVRDAATQQPQPGVSVIAEWFDLVIARGGMMQQPSRRSATTNASGWFVLCGVPGPGTVSILAARGTDSTDRLDLSVSSALFARKDLYLGSAQNSAVLRGRILNEKGGPIAGAIVSVTGSRTRTSADGEWSLSGAKAGTRLLDIRAIGYFPVRRPVDVTDSPGFLRVQMVTFESVLDTMKVSASMLRGADEGGFEQRRRSSGFGRFLSEQDIRRRAPTEVSDIFKSIPGVYHVGDTIKMRSAFGSFNGGNAQCIPNIFLDGNPMPVTVNDLDGWLRPTDIWSVEVYPDVPPPQFQVALSGCGSIVLWTKRRAVKRKD